MISITSIQITPEEIALVTKTLRSGHIVQGSLVEQLETSLARYLGTKHAIAVNSGTAALHTALHAVGVKPGEVVITTPFSFIATAKAIVMCGATPVFADIDPDSFTIDPSSAESVITNKTVAILAVDVYGNPVNYDALRKICKKHNLRLVADACQALGSEYKGQKVGSLADVSVFSLYASKNIFSGEGGIITTNDDEIAKQAKLFRNHGQAPDKQYEYQSLGYNYRLTDLLAAVVIPQIEMIDSITSQRQTNARRLSDTLQAIPGLKVPKVESNTSSCFHQYTIKLNHDFPLTRQKLQEYLATQGIQSRVYYPQLLSSVPHIAMFSRAATLANAEQIVDQVLSLPVHQHLTSVDLDAIIAAVHSSHNHG
jgi:perosamine synthetase